MVKHLWLAKIHKNHKFSPRMFCSIWYSKYNCVTGGPSNACVASLCKVNHKGRIPLKVGMPFCSVSGHTSFMYNKVLHYITHFVYLQKLRGNTGMCRNLTGMLVVINNDKLWYTLKYVVSMVHLSCLPGWHDCTSWQPSCQTLMSSTRTGHQVVPKDNLTESMCYQLADTQLALPPSPLNTKQFS